jgi:hypothetical protein
VLEAPQFLLDSASSILRSVSVPIFAATAAFLKTKFLMRTTDQHGLGNNVRIVQTAAEPIKHLVTASTNWLLDQDRLEMKAAARAGRWEGVGKLGPHR